MIKIILLLLGICLAAVYFWVAYEMKEAKKEEDADDVEE